ncbi:hypothetical protein QTP86_021717 [Hemibagrus guttatus]|nr:hypothetical protein QTP86_021717 [Hemibagrus guttatus]
MNDMEENKNPEEDNEWTRHLKVLQESEQEMKKSESFNVLHFPTSDDDDDDDDMQQFENTSFASDDDEDESETSEEYEEYAEKLYCHPTFSNSVFQALEEMKQLTFLTDLTVRTQNKGYVHAHSLVLAAISSLIQQMLKQANEQNEREICLCVGPEVSDLGLNAVLEFAYTGTISDLNRGSLAQIQAAALYLGVPRVLEICKEERERKKEAEKKTEDSRISAEEEKKVSLQSIRQLWEERVSCDVEVEVEGRIFSAHRVILSASSDYFRAMFSSGMKETHQTSVYDPIQNSWQRLADMNERRGNFALVVLDGKMFAIGGDKDSEFNTGSVEVYCPVTDTWRCSIGLRSGEFGGQINIHSLSTTYLIYTRVTGSLCLSQASLGIKAGYTLDRVPTHCRAHTHSHALTQSHTTDNLEMPINLQCMSLDWGRKPEYPEETPKARGEHANSTRTAEAGTEPPTLEV